MARAGGAVAAVLAILALSASAGETADPPTGWDGVNPFVCELQQVGFEGRGPNPEADPYCVEFDKRRQNVADGGVVDFLSKEPERVAAASPKCFYFQSDHWRGSVVQDDGSTKTYEWDGHYFFDKARGEGGVWVTNFNFNGHTDDPGRIPGVPQEYAQHFGPGTGGFKSRNSVETDPRCAERAAREGDRIYAGRMAGRPGSACTRPGGAVSARRLGPVGLGDGEAEVRRSLGPPVLLKRGFLRYCVLGGGRYLVGQRPDRSGELGEASAERTVMLLATSRTYRYRRVGPGTRTRTLRRALRRARRALRYGATTVYLARPRSAVLFGVRRGRVRFVAVRDKAAVRGAHGLRRYLLRTR